MFEKFEKLVALALEAGFEKAEVFATASDSFSVSVYQGQIEDYRVEKNAGISLRGLYKGQMGYASTEVDSEEEYAQLVQNARDNALALESVDEQFLYDGKEKLDWLSSVNPALAEVTAEQKIQLAMDMEKVCKADARVVSVSSSDVVTGHTSCVLVNSEGLRRTFESNLAMAAVSPILKSGDGQTSGFAFRASRDFSTFHPEEIAREALENGALYIGAEQAASCSIPVIIEKSAMATILSTFAGVFSADAAQRGLSLLAGKEGSKVASDAVTIFDDPSDGLGYAGMPFDGEGVPTVKKAVVENGVLNTLLYTLKTAKKAGKTTTGNASRPSYASTVGTSPTNFYLAPGSATADELMEKLGNGLRIDELMGMHAGANQISGDFSLAAKGMKIENGKLTTPVEQITISGNFFTFLMGITTVANDLWFGFPGASAVGAPSVIVEGLSIAGK